MESVVKLGDVQFAMTGDVKTTEDLKVLLRWGWGAETTGKLSFKPSEPLKIGDGVRVTIEKVVIVPDPVEEQVEEPVSESETGAEPVAEAGNAIEEAGAVCQNQPASADEDDKKSETAETDASSGVSVETTEKSSRCCCEDTKAV
jgi:predicted DNA-binding antitoxin AbrB/MazE fold protein